MNKRKLLFLAIIGWTILGFALQLDLTQRWGCLVFAETHLMPYRISFLIVSVVVIGACIFLANEDSQLKLLAAELGCWLIVFLLVKGGYAVGFGGGPDEAIMGYDLIALFPRLFSMSFYLKVGLREGTGKRIMMASITAVVVVMIKADTFALPMISLP